MTALACGFMLVGTHRKSCAGVQQQLTSASMSKLEIRSAPGKVRVVARNLMISAHNCDVTLYIDFLQGSYAV